MNNKPTKRNTPIIVLLYLLAALFLGYGIYMVYDAVTYVQTYDTEAAVSTANIIQYVANQSASYFGFAIVIFAAAVLLGSLNRVHSDLYLALTTPYFAENLDEDPLADDGEQISLDLNNNEVYSENPPEPETAEEDESELKPEIDSAMSEPAFSSELIQEAEPEIIPEPDPETNREFLSEPESPDEPESLSEPEPSSGPVIPQEVEVTADPQEAPEPEVAHAPLAEEFMAQPDPEPVMEPATDEPKPVPVMDTQQIPESILQSKRKRGLKYETVAMEEPEASIQQTSSDTIRLTKEETETISSSFIKGIFEKNQ